MLRWLNKVSELTHSVVPAAVRSGVGLAATAMLLLLTPLSTALGQADFNHDRTGYHLDGAHARARCLSCHGQGILRGTPKACDQCHILGNRSGTTIVQGPNHVPVTIGTACDLCHKSTTAFQTWRMDHTATTLPCASCHSGQSFEGVVPMTKTPNHPVTTADCSQCHASTTSFTVVSRYDHVGVVPGTCLNCHGATAAGRPIGHMPAPAGLSCDVCHRSTATFSIWTMDHAAANIVVGSATCASCHGGQTFLGVTPTPKPSGHTPTNAQCDTCHNSTVTFASVVAGAGNPHTVVPPTPGTCTNCHNGTVATGQIGGHIATNGVVQCDVCHSSVAASFATWNMSAANHGSVSATCSNCHAAGRTFPGATMVTQATNAPHIPTASQCSACHLTIPASVPSPGAGTGFQTWTMTHAGITTGCVNCHGSAAAWAAIVKMPATGTGGHIPTSLPCENCHSSSSTAVGQFRTAVVMSHTGIVSGCNVCHDVGASFLPMVPALVTKPVGNAHIPTSGPCEWCHLSTTIPNGFKTQSMNHTGIVAGCNACHAVAGASSLYPPGSQGAIVGQPTSHIPTGAQDCAGCHVSTQIPGGFKLSVSSFDHVKAGVQPGTCTNCHNGTTATGPITGHIPVSAGRTCDTCHAFGVGGFQKWNMKHIGVPANCTNCHAGAPNFPGATMVTFTSKGTHFPIGAAQCSACHTPPANVPAPGGGTGFATWTMSHAAVSGNACSTCHAIGASWVGAVPVVTYPASGHIPVTGGTNSACNDCHTASDTPGSGAFKNFSTNLHNSTSVTGLTCKTCHDLGKSFMASNPPLVTLPASGHIPLTAGTLPAADCNACHTGTPVITGGFQTGFRMPSAHFGIVAGCSSCHGATTQLFPGVIHQVSGHTPTNAPCENCHNSTTVPGGFASVVAGAGNPHAPPNPAPVLPCTNCHNGVNATGQIAGHIPTLANVQCGVCHNSAATSFATFTMDVAQHGPANVTQACSTCHATGKSFPGTTMVTQGTVTHIPTLAGNECSVCHTGASRSVGAFATWTFTTHNAVSTALCATCHGSANFTGGGAIVKTPVGHVAYTASADCNKCHTTTTIPGGFAVRKTDHTLITVPATCNTCHTGQVFPTGVTPKRTTDAPTHIAILGGVDCNLCHTTTTVPGGFATRSMQHSGVNTATCNGCHTGQTFSTGVTPKQKPAPGHIPVTGDCSACHTNTTTPGGFAIFSMNHAAVTALQPCAACHSAASAATFMASTPAIVTPPVSHTPAFLAGKDCSNAGCHKTTDTGPGGFGLAGKVHTAADAGKCNTCHGAGGTALTQQSAVTGAGHIITAAQCDQCHNYPPTAPHFSSWTMRHSAVAGTTCITCHSQGQVARTGPFGGAVTVIGIPAQGSPGHVTLTNSACNQCHTAKDVSVAAASGATSGFAGQGTGWTMNHAGVNIATCNNCHTQNGPGVTFATGVIPVFRPANHFTTAADCKTCHSSLTSFKVGSMSHTGIVNNCQTCHGNAPPGITFANVIPVFKPANHIATTNADCSGCHVNTSTFTVWTMNHTYVNTATCNNCHTGQVFATGVVAVAKGANHIVTAQECKVCHSPSTVTFAGGRMGTAEHVANGNTASCIACHNGQAFQGVTPVTKPGNHIPTSGDCALCHSTSNFAVGAFATGWTMRHAGVVGCSQCHNGQTFATGVTPVSKIDTPSPGHVPTSADCTNCHAAKDSATKVSTMWSPRSPSTQVHSAALLTGYATSTCYPCHGNSSGTWYAVTATGTDLKVMWACGNAAGLKKHGPKCTVTNCHSAHNPGSKF